MRLNVSLLLLAALACIFVADGVNARSVRWPPSCCNKGEFCCGDQCRPQHEAVFSKCAPVKGGCCKPKDPCKEKPYVVGFCKGAFPRWTFDQKKGTCEPFTYGGCGGNGNNFKSEKECIKKCDAKPPSDCCPVGEKCCGDGCIPDNAQTFAPCGEPKCCNKPEPCFCPQVFKPVCCVGTGKTFGNKCEADCPSSGCTGKITEGACEDPPIACRCANIDKPVCCLKTGKTFGNECLASCPGGCKGDTAPGKCPEKPKPCICTLEYNPQCCVATGKTFGNPCQAKCPDGGCKGKLVPGKCPEKPKPCVCSKEYNPQCCVGTGKTFGNPCMAKCGCKGKISPGRCEPKEDCNCIALFDPVCCVKTGKTFSNSCTAGCPVSGCKGKTVKGACPKPKPLPKPVPLPHPLPGKVCCAKNEICCGDGCLDKKLAPVALCPVNGLCGCSPKDEDGDDDEDEDDDDDDDEEKPKGCCTKDAPVCCGDTCLTKEDAARTRCKPDALCGCSADE